MKKILTLTLLILFVFGTLLSAQNPEKTPRQKGKTFQRGPKFEKIIFGISEKDYNSLNLTETQLNQINTLQTNYRNEIMAEMKKNINTKNNRENIPNKPFANPMQNINPELQNKMRAAEKKLNEDFKALLTDEQKIIYNKAYETQINKQKEQFNKQFENMSKVITFTDEQKAQIKKLLDAYTGDQVAFNTEFAKIITDEQRALYQQYLQEQFKQNNPNVNKGKRQRIPKSSRFNPTNSEQ